MRHINKVKEKLITIFKGLVEEGKGRGRKKTKLVDAIKRGGLFQLRYSQTKVLKSR